MKQGLPAYVIALFFIVCLWISGKTQSDHHPNVIVSDKGGYYLYLPAIFLYHDLAHLSFRDTVKNYWDEESKLYLHYQASTGRYLDKYPIGVAIFELPFFALAHLYTITFKDYPPDGYSMPYQYAVIINSIVWAAIGLFVLCAFLKKYFSWPVVLIVIICISFGTNLYTYAAFDQGMSHPVSFFIFSSIIYITDAWYKTGRKKYCYLLGILSGLTFIVRPINIIVVMLPLLWQVHGLASLRERMRFFKLHFKPVLIAIVLLLAIVSIQAMYWKYTTGHWLYYSYEKESFDFRHSRIWKGLFSYRKGWFVYTPLAFIGVLGFPALWHRRKEIVPGLFLFLALMIYVVFSWNNWWYGGGFSCRPLIEALPLVAIPLAALIEYIGRGKKLLKAVFYPVLLVFIALNIFQSYQYSRNVIHFSRMTRAAYWHVLLSGSITENPGDKKLLLNDKEAEEE